MTTWKCRGFINIQLSLQCRENLFTLENHDKNHHVENYSLKDCFHIGQFCRHCRKNLSAIRCMFPLEDLATDAPVERSHFPRHFNAFLVFPAPSSPRRPPSSPRRRTESSAFNWLWTPSSVGETLHFLRKSSKIGWTKNKKKAVQVYKLEPPCNFWGERWDLNQRPPRPQPGATTS